VTIDGVWIDNWIYWIPIQYTQLQCIHFTTLNSWVSLDSLSLATDNCNWLTHYCLWLKTDYSTVSISAESSPARAQDLLQTHSLHWLFSEDCNSTNSLVKVKVKVTLWPTTSQSVCPSVLVSRPIWASWPDINFRLTFTFYRCHAPPLEQASMLAC
jgi:hypothetical protein